MTGPDTFEILKQATGYCGDGWGFEVYCTFPQSIAWTNPGNGQGKANSTINSKADLAIERIKQWTEFGLRQDEGDYLEDFPSPPDDPDIEKKLLQCLRWTVHFVPGASVETIRSAHNEYLASKSVQEYYEDGEPGLLKRTERMCLMLDEDMADAILASSAVPEDLSDDQSLPKDIFIEALDPEYEGEPIALAQAGRGPPPPYPAKGVDWYIGSIKCAPVFLWPLYRDAMSQFWGFQRAMGRSVRKDLYALF